jgi:D-aspartate ligase
MASLPDAIILGSGTNALGIARSLGKAGVEVLSVPVRNYDPCRFSRYCKSLRLLPYEGNESLFLQQLIEKAGSRHKKPVLFSESDTGIMFMSRNREALSHYFSFSLSAHELLEAIMDKHESVLLMSQKGLHVPTTYLYRRNSLADTVNRIKYPCILKPVNSYSVNLGRKNMFFSDPGSLKSFLSDRQILENKVVIQEIVPGGDANVYQATAYVTKDGSIPSIFTMRKIRQCPPDFGLTSYGVSEEVPYLMQEVPKLLEALSYKGFLSIEFKFDVLTNRWLYIEANPRLPYYHSLIYDTGINFPLIAYADISGRGPTRGSASQKNGIRWINFGSDLRSFSKKFGRNETGVMDWCVSVLNARSFAFFDMKDLKPLLFVWFHFLRSAGKKITA